MLSVGAGHSFFNIGNTDIQFERHGEILRVIYSNSSHSPPKNLVGLNGQNDPFFHFRWADVCERSYDCLPHLSGKLRKKDAFRSISTWKSKKTSTQVQVLHF